MVGLVAQNSWFALVHLTYLSMGLLHLALPAPPLGRTHSLTAAVALVPEPIDLELFAQGSFKSQYPPIPRVLLWPRFRCPSTPSNKRCAVVRSLVHDKGTFIRFNPALCLSMLCRALIPTLSRLLITVIPIFGYALLNHQTLSLSCLISL